MTARSAFPAVPYPYTVVRHLASGGMATLYLAQHPRFGKVVIKCLKPEFETTSEYVTMFRDETRLSRRLRHPNIVHVLDDTSDDLFIMELLTGQDLYSIVRHLNATRQALPLAIAIGIVLEVCRALDYAHQQTAEDGTSLGIVHRDVSPQNIFITYQGGVKLLDFGIAKSEGRETRTKTGTFKGKFFYMSPEHVTSRKIDGRADVFSLCIVLWELTTGRRYYSAQHSEFEVLKQLVNSLPIPPSVMRPGYPYELEAIVLKGLRLSPEARHSAGALQHALEHFVAIECLDVSQRRRAGWIQDLFADDVIEALTDHDRLAAAAHRRIGNDDEEFWYEDFSVCDDTTARREPPKLANDDLWARIRRYPLSSPPLTVGFVAVLLAFLGLVLHS